MLSIRQKKIIKIIQKESCSVHDIADILQVSNRTILREIKAINDELTDVAQIMITGSCYLKILSLVKFYQLLGQTIPNKINLLYHILIKNNLSLDYYSEKLYLPKSKIREYITQLNDECHTLFKIEVKPSKGIVFKCSINTQIDLLANILNDYPKTIQNDNNYRQLNVNNYDTTAKKYIEVSQIINQEKACYLLKINSLKQKEYFIHKLNLLNLIELKERDIKENISKIFFSNGFDVPTSHIFNTCLQHIIREALFPTLIMKNKEDIKLYITKQPLAFDIAKAISNYFNKTYSIEIKPYYLSLYVMLAISTFDSSIYKVIIVSHRQSLSSINKYLIESQIKGVQVHIIDNITDLDNISNKYVVILDAELVSNYSTDKNMDLIVSGVITNAEILQLKQLLRMKTFSKILEEVNKNHTIQISNVGTEFMSVLNTFLTVLKEKSLISIEEQMALVKREEAGNQLVINNYSLPHIISNEQRKFKLFKATLKTPVIVSNQFIDTILIVIIGTDVTNKSEIFKYLFDVINAK